MAANTTSTLARSAFPLAGPAITTPIPPPSASPSRRTDLHMRIHQAHVRAHIRRLQALGRGLPSTTRHSQRTTRAVAHTVPPITTTTTTTTATATTITTTTTNLTIRAPQPRRPLSAIILNGLPTPPDTPAPAQPQTQPETQTQTRPQLLTRRSRTRAARTGFHGTGAGLSFGLDVFGDDVPVLTPRAAESFPAADDGVRRTPGAPARARAGYFQDVSPTTQAEGEGENVFHAI